MTVSAISGTTAASTAATSSTTAAAATNQLSYNDFLTLLMAELKNQDPSQPMDPAQMVSQVGQAVQTNTNLQSLLTSSSLSQAELLVGQTISSADGTKSGQVTSVSVSSTGATANLANGDTIPLASGAIIQ